MWCLCRKSSNHWQHQTPFSLFRLMVLKGHGDANPVAKACGFWRHASLKNLNSASTFTRGAKSNTQVVLIVTVAICVEYDSDTPGRWHVHRHTKSCVDPRDMKCVAWKIGMFSHRTNEHGLGLVPRSLFRIEFESGPHVYTFDWDRLAGQCLLQMELNTFTFVRSDLFVSPGLGPSAQSNMFRSSGRIRVLVSSINYFCFIHNDIPATRTPRHLPHAFSSTREATKVFCTARAAKLPMLPPPPVEAVTVLAAHPTVSAFHTSYFLRHYCAESDNIRSQRLNVVRSDFIFSFLAVLPFSHRHLSGSSSECGASSE